MNDRIMLFGGYSCAVYPGVCSVVARVCIGNAYEIIGNGYVVRNANAE
jgi:hypothetical protein